MAFSLLLTRVISCDFDPLGRVWCHYTSLSSNLYLKGCQFCSIFFFIKEIIESTLPCVFDCPPAWSCLSSVQFGFGMRLCEGRFDKELFSCRNFRISKLFQIHKSFWYWFKANSFRRNSRDCYREVKWWKVFILLLVKNMKWHLVCQKGFKFQFEGYWEPNRFKEFILFAWIMI